MPHSVRPVLIACLAAILVGGCTKVSEQTGPAAGGGHSWTIHGVLRMATVSNPDTLNTLVGEQQVDVDLSMFWCGYLLNWSDKNEFVPELATDAPTLANGGIAKDGLSITYHLRKGVLWHDGQPFSADDVIFTWQAVMNPNNNVQTRLGYDLITGIDKKDPYTIVVHLRKKYAPFVNSFFTMSSTPYCIIPKHVLGSLKDINHAPYNNKPIGTGPFMVERYEQGNLVKLVANPHYWRGAPKLKEIDFKIIPDENTILTQLRTHEVDFEYNAPSAQAPSLRDIPGTNYLLTQFTQYGQLALNTTSPALSDVNVRRALYYGTNRQEVIDKISHGVNVKGDSDQPSFLWAHADGLPQYEFDLAKANKMLDDAGWKAGPDGIRAKNGQRLSVLAVTATGAATSIAMVTYLQQAWRKLGVDVQVKSYNPSLLFATYQAGGIIQGSKFDIAFYSWVNGIDPDDATNFLCDQFPPHGQNVYKFCDKDLDAAEQIALTDYDQSHRKAAYDKVQRILADKVPLIIMWFNRRQDVFNTDFKNYKPAHAVTEFWNTWEWSI